MQKRLEFKCASKTRSCISGSDEHWRIKGKWRCVTTICQHTSSVEGCRGWKSIWSGSVTIHRSVDVDRNATKCDGNKYECTKFYRGEKTQSSWTEPHFWTKVFAFQILNDLCGYRRNKTMINMLRGWRIGKTLVNRNNGLLRHGLSFCLWWIRKHCHILC
jgi:hypothetical protein